MYEKHFNLQERPFRNIPDTKMFFDGGGRGEILQALHYAIKTGEGIVKVVGEVGNGKTMLCRKLNESLPNNIEVVFLENPSLEPEYILHAVAKELGLPVSLNSNRFAVQQILRKYLLAQHAAGKRIVVLIEEAQCMPPRTLEEIRLMSNLETEDQKLLQLVLFGQPELNTLLAREDLRQLTERISYSLDLKPFSFDELKDYLNHRLRKAGCPTQDLFNIRVVKHIYKFAQGSVRRINLLADKTLLAAYAYNDTTITIQHARSAAEDCDFIERVGVGLPLKIIIPTGISAVVAMVFWLIPTLQYGSINTTKNASDLSTQYSTQEFVNSTNNVSQVDYTDLAPVPQHNRKFLDREEALSPESIVYKRVDETMRWLEQADSSQYTIQLMTSFVNDPSELRDLEEMLSRRFDPKDVEDFFVFHGTANGESVYVVCFKVYPGVTPAKSAIPNLPEVLKRYRPFVRSVSSIMKEIGDNNV